MNHVRHIPLTAEDFQIALWNDARFGLRYGGCTRPLYLSLEESDRRDARLMSRAQWWRSNCGWRDILTLSHPHVPHVRGRPFLIDVGGKL